MSTARHRPARPLALAQELSQGRPEGAAPGLGQRGQTARGCGVLAKEGALWGAAPTSVLQQRRGLGGRKVWKPTFLHCVPRASPAAGRRGGGVRGTLCATVGSEGDPRGSADAPLLRWGLGRTNPISCLRKLPEKCCAEANSPGTLGGSRSRGEGCRPPLSTPKASASLFLQALCLCGPGRGHRRVPRHKGD